MDDTNIILDVEDDAQRQTRIQSLLEKLNSEAKPQTPAGPPKFDFGDRSTCAVNPPSELLSRVQAFLPQLQASNETLTQRMQEDPDSVNIEHVSDNVDRYIQMNLGLGVFEDRSRKTQEDHDTEMSSTSSSSSEGLNQDGSDVDSDASSEIITSFVPVRPIKPLPRRSLNRARPQITVLEEKSQH
ncbi:hypothetical protein P691DRAFT_737425 [Macrolepiota fuliginosa MF-IS2]|uniref:Uncharacterized protein n=1 Tax=Macrolepiota fuliginosa MF-IS2 TaxID=1400762 RepID=A0A9P5X5V7_9AGAR|nr:hypothetical protein P691DRAFT_737425 [Macrolepiota fuliginosa MF-IS2]